MGVRKWMGKLNWSPSLLYLGSDFFTEGKRAESYNLIEASDRTYTNKKYYILIN